MFTSINKAYRAQKRAAEDNKFILEAAMDELEVEEVIPGSDEEVEDVVDVDSVPDEVYKKVDAALDKIVSDPKYDDTEITEMLDGDDGDPDENEVSDEELEVIMDEAVDAWYDDENFHHPDTARRSKTEHQPRFEVDGHADFTF